MAAPRVTEALAHLEGSAVPPPNRPSAYNELLQRIASDTSSTTTVADLTAFIDSVLGENIGIVAARPLLASAVAVIQTLPNVDDKISVGQHALSSLQSRVVSFEDQDAGIRELLADTYQAKEEWAEAAKMLSGINLESSQRKISDPDRVRLHMRICRLYLEEEDTTTAESYLNRAKILIHDITDVPLRLEFDLSQARIYDARRRFFDAGSAYHQISMSDVLAEDEKTRCLSAAVTCAVLVPAGPLRARLLAKLYKDHRSPQLEEFGILEKMFLNRLLRPDEVERFAGGLAPHQLALTSDGTTVLEKAVVEHNLLSASRLYANIGIKELAVLLACDADKAEEYAANMLEQGRLKGHIDQIDGVIFFYGADIADGVAGDKAKEEDTRRAGPADLRQWDTKVKDIAQEIENVASLLQEQEPVSGRRSSWYSAATDLLSQELVNAILVH